MPLRAQINGKDIIAPLLDDVEWEGLKCAVKQREVAVILPCCHNTAFLRVSPLGTKHFVHTRQQNCQWKPESMEQVQVKSEIVLACNASGYDVSTEVVEIDWRADVLATKGHANIAFEVLLRSQSLEGILHTQQQYARNGIRGCWLIKHVPKEYMTPTHELPLFQLARESERDYYVSIELDKWVIDEEKHLFPLYHFVTTLLSGKIRFCSHVRTHPSQHITIVFFDMACWRCNNVSHVFAVEGEYTSMCGVRMPVAGGMWSAEKFCFRPEILESVKEYLQTPEAEHLKVGAIKPRYSKTVKKSYMSFGCAYCDAILGDWYVHEAYIDTTYTRSGKEVELLVKVHDPVLYESPHWCYSEDRTFCKQL